MNLSTHFTLEELTRSDTARRMGINNTIPEHLIPNMQRLCTEVLEPVREHFQSPVIVTSGYRSPALNKAVAGAPKSQHITGEAVDFIMHTVTPIYGIWEWMKWNIPVYDQLIYETELSTQKVWIHVSIKAEGNRHEFLIINK